MCIVTRFWSLPRVEPRIVRRGVLLPGLHLSSWVHAPSTLPLHRSDRAFQSSSVSPKRRTKFSTQTHTIPRIERQNSHYSIAPGFFKNAFLQREWCTSAVVTSSGSVEREHSAIAWDWIL